MACGCRASSFGFRGNGQYPKPHTSDAQPYLDDPPDGGDDVVLVRERPPLKAFGVRQRHVLAADPLRWRVQVVKRGVHDAGDDLATDATLLGGLVADYEAPRLLDRLHDGVDVQRRDRARIDHLDADALLGQLLGRLE